jgi:hypothetical protein
MRVHLSMTAMCGNVTMQAQTAFISAFSLARDPPTAVTLLVDRTLATAATQTQTLVERTRPPAGAPQALQRSVRHERGRLHAKKTPPLERG